MKTVKEISVLTGISVRTLHYYDEIGLLKPTTKSESGYRLYDDKALDTLQQILFFREFDIPLKEIKAVMNNPQLDEKQILQTQRKMLVANKVRMERLIASIDSILKGENKMSFEVFNKNEIEDMYNSLLTNMSEQQKAILIDQYGSLDAFQKYFMENASSESAQKNFQKVVEWYGNKESALAASQNPGNSELLPTCQRRLEAILKKLAEKKDCDENSYEVKEIVAEYDFISKEMYQMEDLSKMMLEVAELYQSNEEIQKLQDSIYGEGTTEFLGKALKAFYKVIY